MHPRLHRADGGGEIVRRHIAAQQHLIADDQRADRCRDSGWRAPPPSRSAARFLSGLARQPEPCMTFRPWRAAIAGDLVLAELDRIGAHAVGDLGEARQSSSICAGEICVAGSSGVWRAAERRIGQAIKLFAGRQRRVRHRPPAAPSQAQKRGDGDRRHGKQAKTKAHRREPGPTGLVASGPAYSAAVSLPRSSCAHPFDAIALKRWTKPRPLRPSFAARFCAGNSNSGGRRKIGMRETFSRSAVPGRPAENAALVSQSGPIADRDSGRAAFHQNRRDDAVSFNGCVISVPRSAWRPLALRRPRAAWPKAAATPSRPSSRSRPRTPPTAKEGQKKIDEIAEAARVLAGPAGNPECVWLGRRVVSLLWRDDLDTAFRHLDLYDRFGCPSAHIQATFRCLVRQGNIDPEGPGKPERPRPCLLAQSRASPRPRPRPPQPPAAATSGGTRNALTRVQPTVKIIFAPCVRDKELPCPVIT